MSGQTFLKFTLHPKRMRTVWWAWEFRIRWRVMMESLSKTIRACLFHRLTAVISMSLISILKLLRSTVWIILWIKQCRVLMSIHHRRLGINFINTPSQNMASNQIKLRNMGYYTEHYLWIPGPKARRFQRTLWLASKWKGRSRELYSQQMEVRRRNPIEAEVPTCIPTRCWIKRPSFLIESATWLSVASSSTEVDLTISIDRWFGIIGCVTRQMTLARSWQSRVPTWHFKIRFATRSLWKCQRKHAESFWAIKRICWVLKKRISKMLVYRCRKRIKKARILNPNQLYN